MNASQRIADLISAIVGMKVSHVWKGYGSTIYLELGDLTPSALTRKDGSSGNPRGEVAIGLHWGWRLESEERIVCGSDSNKDEMLSGLSKLNDQTILGVTFVGRVQELNVSFSNKLYLASFMTRKSDPDWEIMDRRGGTSWAMACTTGQIHMKECPVPAPKQSLM